MSEIFQSQDQYYRISQSEMTAVSRRTEISQRQLDARGLQYSETL